MNIGIDFGGVLSIHDLGSKEHINTSINMPNALESLYALKETHNLFLISFHTIILKKYFKFIRCAKFG